MGGGRWAWEKKRGSEQVSRIYTKMENSKFVRHKCQDGDT